jgi:hypothetical protein
VTQKGMTDGQCRMVSNDATNTGRTEKGDDTNANVFYPLVRVFLPVTPTMLLLGRWRVG